MTKRRVEPFQLGSYADIATFDKDDDDRSELHAAFNNMNWTQFLAYVYEVDGIVVISSSQYVGTRKINQDEVIFMLQSMNEKRRECVHSLRCFLIPNYHQKEN